MLKLVALVTLPFMLASVQDDANSHVIKEDAGVHEKHREAYSQLLRFVENREALIRGEFTVEATTAGTSESEARGDTIRCYFDLPSSRYFFERQGYRNIGVSPVAELTEENKGIRRTKEEAQKRLRSFRSAFVRNNEYSTGWFAMGEPDEPDRARTNLDIFPPDRPPSVNELECWHPSAIGLLLFSDAGKLEDSRSLVESWFKECESSTVAIMKDGSIQVELQYKAFRRVFLLDPSRENVITHYSISESPKQGLPEGNETSHLGYFSEIEWTEVNSVFIPDHVQTTTRLPRRDPASVAFDLTWTSVNPESIDADRFSYSKFEGLWDGVHVFERRGELGQ